MGKIEAPDKTDIKVFISSRDSRCDECKEDLGRGAWITLREGKGALCLSCADLDHLVFLLMRGYDRHEARIEAQDRVQDVLDRWSSAAEP